MRPVDLAGRADVSTQHVRNLEVAGVLPDAVRTPSGYRQYNRVHLSALLTYQALATGHGAPRARTIMIAIGRADVPEALALLNASHASFDEQRRTLDETSRTLEEVAEQDTGMLPASAEGMRVGDLARELGVRPSALRVWEDAGLLTP